MVPSEFLSRISSADLTELMAFYRLEAERNDAARKEHGGR